LSPHFFVFLTQDGDSDVHAADKRERYKDVGQKPTHGGRGEGNNDLQGKLGDLARLTKPHSLEME